MEDSAEISTFIFTQDKDVQEQMWGPPPTSVPPPAADALLSL